MVSLTFSFCFVIFNLSRYMLAEGLGLSGIVSILFTGIVSKSETSEILILYLYFIYIILQQLLWVFAFRL